jgi:DNA helicase HerA-like ATPase
MSSIYNKPKYNNLLDGGLTGSPSTSNGFPVRNNDGVELSKEPQAEIVSQDVKNANLAELKAYQERSNFAMKLVDDIVLKNYLTKLPNMEIIPADDEVLDTSNIILFKINEMVYEKDEYATDKFISVVSAMTFTNSSIFLIADGHKDHTDFYLGIKCEDELREKSYVAETLKSSILGQFPGAILDDYSFIQKNEERPMQDRIIDRIKDAVSISSCVGIPSYKNSKGEYSNANFIQGIEKFASAMQGKEYTAVILASNINKAEIANIRNGYEKVYTELSTMATRQLAYSTNESLANALSRTKGTSDTHTVSNAEGISDSASHTESKSSSKSKSKSHTDSESKENAWGKASKVGGAIAGVGMALTATGAGAPVGIALMAGGALLGGVGACGAKNKSKSDTETLTETESYTSSDGITHTKSITTTVSDAHSDSFSQTNGTTSTIGSSKNFTITVQDKHIQEVLKRIDKQLERIEACESSGLWSTGAYFMSYGTDNATAEIGATIFRSIMQGEQSGVESSAISTWRCDKDDKNNEEVRKGNEVAKYVSALSHPAFVYENLVFNTQTSVYPTSLLSSKEVAIMLGLPRKSVPGLPVIEHISLGKEVVRLNRTQSGNKLELGCIFDQGVERKDNKVYLDAKSLTQHTFVTGSTGCGKSNTIYYLVEQIRHQPDAPKFLVIEPAKGEYKDVFGNEHIYGTNPLKTPLLKINPFRFPEGVHVLEHIDRLIEIFNVCWPMYAAMPAVLKEAILNAYEDCGWNLYKSTNRYSNELFPTFADLLNELVLVINNSAYSEEVKSNYQGSLVTRVKSLDNGICKQIFSCNELGDQVLFDENVIIDLSRIGSQETKSLIMGILIMRLNEYRANSGILHNSPLRHVTILEEAHNILKRCSQDQSMEGSNVAGKSVEMISNAIAEMRTYGEGFVIVDQSPGAIDVSAIRNTNTKIIMRLPEDSDRKVAGKASGMKDEQVDEIAKLPTGVAVVYQNDWEEPVLCKIGKFDKEEIPFVGHGEDFNEQEDSPETTIEILKLLLKGRVSCPIDADIDVIEKGLVTSGLSTFNKTSLYEAVDEYKKMGELKLWNDNRFETLSKLVTQIVSLKSEVTRLANTTVSFEELTQKLTDLVEDKVPYIPEELLAVTSQCLMRDYSLDGEVQKRIYSAWYQSINVNKVL